MGKITFKHGFFVAILIDRDQSIGDQLFATSFENDVAERLLIAHREIKFVENGIGLFLVGINMRRLLRIVKC